MTSFGMYQVVEPIGEGGFGKVYKGYDARLKRYVAIKTVSLSAHQARERFMREAEIAANLHHPSIVTVYDFGEQDGVPYLVQEFLSGEDLARRIARRDPGSYETRVRQLIEVAVGLRFAHSRGVVHRDIKPANVRVLDDGSIRIMDFGIAKLLSSELQITGTNMSVGTSGYVSPEQLEGREIDHRADIFSFGVMAYELFTLKRPFEAETIPATLYRILTEEPQAIATLVPDCPQRLVACVERCLRKNRDERYRDFGEVITELESIAADFARPVGGEPVASTAAAATAVTTMAYPEQHERGAAGAATDSERGARRGTGLQKAAIIAGAAGLIALSAWALTAVVGRLSDRRPGPDDEPPLGGTGTDSAYVDSTRVAGADSLDADSIHVIRDDSGLVVAGGDTGSDSSDQGGGSDPDDPDPPAPQVEPDRVLVLIRGARREAVGTAETTILGELLARGRSVVDPGTLDRARADAAAGRAFSSGNGSAVAAIGVEFGAGTVVVAELSTDVTSVVAGFITGTAVMNARYYDSVSGELLLAERYQIGAGGVPGRAGSTETDAITQAADAVARQMARAILQKTGR